MSEGHTVPPLTAEIEAVLQRYLAIQQEEEDLRREKTELQEALAAHLAGLADMYWDVEVAGTPLRVRHRREVDIRYDEERLRDRLGDRYTRILSPDWRKMRRQLDQVASCLEPVLEQIGSPDRDKVRAAVEQGIVAADEFAGAFEKRVLSRVAVSRRRHPGDE